MSGLLRQCRVCWGEARYGYVDVVGYCMVLSGVVR